MTTTRLNHTPNTIAQNQRGSFLLEALLSVVILSVSITIIIHSLASAARTTTQTSRYITASVLADDYLTEILWKRFIESGVYRAGNFERPYEKFRYLLETRRAEHAPDGINEVSLDVSWPSRNTSRKLKVKTYLLKPLESVTP